MDLEALVLDMMCVHFVDLIFWNLLGILVDLDSELLFSTSITSTDSILDIAYDHRADVAILCFDVVYLLEILLYIQGEYAFTTLRAFISTCMVL